MGLYSNNTFSNLNNIEFPTLEGYSGMVGAGIALVEGYQNDFALFEAGVRGDFAEIAAIQEGADVLPLQEASIKGFFDKIIEFFKKLGAKIKAIFNTFAAKLSSYFTKDNKDFVKKYKKTVFGPGRDYSKMKAKYSKPKQNGYIYNVPYGAFTITMPSKDIVTNDNKEFDREDAIEQILKDQIGSLPATTISEISEEMHDAMYEDEELKDDWTMGDISSVANRLEAGNKAISDIEKKNKNLQDTIKKVINDLQKDQTTFAKKLPTKDGGKYVDYATNDYNRVYKVDVADGRYSHTGIGGKVENEKGVAKLNINNEQKRLSWMQSTASAHQSCILAYCSAVMKEAKFGIAQDRRIYAQAVSFRNVTKEDYDLLAAVGEAVDFETESDFEAMEFIA